MESGSKSVRQFYAHGKLLLTGEYFILDGAKALALPTKPGQWLSVKPVESPSPGISWKSLDHLGKIWFSAVFDHNDFKPIKNTDREVSLRLQRILKAIRNQNAAFLREEIPVEVETKLEFPRLWGLGTSSTLIYNLSRWSETDPFRLLDDTFGGSGYDIACAGAEGPLIYKKTEKGPGVQPTNFDPPFKKQLFFVYLGKKQNSREGIRRYRGIVHERTRHIDEITTLTETVRNARELNIFIDALKKHEDLVSGGLQLPKVQDRLFPDFPGLVKSLGAWGGDFVLAASDWEKPKIRNYFNDKGFEVFLAYEELIL